MTKFFMWILGEDINEHLDMPVKILFNTMMLGLSTFFVMNIVILVGMLVVGISSLINLFL